MSYRQCQKVEVHTLQPFDIAQWELLLLDKIIMGVSVIEYGGGL